jgi:hypothetical protein
MKIDNEKRLSEMAGCRRNIKNDRNRSLNYINVGFLFPVYKNIFFIMILLVLTHFKLQFEKL